MGNRSNIVLIGMPGCGKSTCGVLAAKALCMSFADTDLLIQESEGMTLQKIIDTLGAEYFARAEERCLCAMKAENTVIATGGSAVYYDSAMSRFREIGKIIYLKISLEEMMRRISNISSRGILLGQGESIENMYRKRAPLYERWADSVIECGGLSIERTVDAICGSV